jgi:competence protein ComEC
MTRADKKSSSDDGLKDFAGRTNVLPLAQLAAGFAVGILLAQTDAPIQLVMLGAVFSTALTVTCLTVNRSQLAAVSLFIAVMFCSATLALLEMRTPEPERVKRLLEDGVVAPTAVVEVTGVLQRNPESSWNNLYLIISVERIRLNKSDLKASGLVTLIAPVPPDERMDYLELRYGARIRFMTKLERTNEFRNPGVSPFTEFLDRKGYDANGYIKSLRLIERLEDDRVFIPLSWLYDWRSRLQQEIDSRFSKNTAGVLDAALLGNRYNLSSDVEERFRDGGTFHVLVISGLHITFLGGLAFVVMRWFTRNRNLQFAASVTLVWSYSLAVGAEPTIARAALMFTVVMFAPLVSRRASALNGLGIVAIALLLWKPSNLFDPSFQLTFVSVLAIVVLAWPLVTRLSAIGSWRPTRVTPFPPSCPRWLRQLSDSLFWNELEGTREMQRANYKYRLIKSFAANWLLRMRVQRLLRFAFVAVVVSVSVQVALLPFLIVYFHRFSVASFVLNMFVGVMMVGVALTALAAVAVSQVSPVLASPLIMVANAGNWLMVHSVDPFSQVHIASIRLPEYTGWAFSLYLFYYVPLAVLAFCLAKWKPLELRKHSRVSRRIVSVALVAQVIAIAVMIIHPLSSAENEGKLSIDFLDVGQGDAALITLPDDTTILVDGGGRPGPFRRNGNDEDEQAGREGKSIGESVVSEYLWWRGLKRVDYLLATHADADHIEGLNDIARNFAVRAVLVGRSPSRDPEFAKLLESLALRSVPVRLIAAGDQLKFGKVSMDVLWPRPAADAQSSGNNDSVVLRIKYGTRSVLLTGDIESKTEDALVRLHPNDLVADVTKVAHHGSRTSSTQDFVTATGSRLAVISVGQSSMFGHPHSEVVERWRSQGARVVTTGNRGMISLTTDGQNMQFRTFVNP